MKELILIIELIIIRAKVLQNNLIIYNDIKNGRISLQKEENIQEEFSSKLNEILKGNLNYKSKDQINTIKNIKKLYDGPGKVLNFLMVILEWYWWLNTNQFMEKGSKY